MNNPEEAIFTITDLKQYIYCPRIFYYHACLPGVRPVTYKMQRGINAHEDERRKAARRSLAMYDLPTGQRTFDLPILSETLGLSGQIDEVIESEGEYIPVDYKLAQKIGDHFRVQVAAYALLLEAQYAVAVKRGFLYLIQSKQVEEIAISTKLRTTVQTALREMRRIQQQEWMPPPAASPRQCVDCEFRRFCNDV